MRDIRPAIPGDICLMLRPHKKTYHSILALQQKYQTFFGGIFHKEVHLTLQRFSMKDQTALSRNTFFDLLNDLKPNFKITSEDIFITPHEFWNETLLRWKVTMSEQILSYTTAINRALTELNADLHYPEYAKGSFRPVTILEKIENHDIQKFKERHPFPETIFTPGTIIVSKILGRRIFEDIKIISI